MIQCTRRKINSHANQLFQGRLRSFNDVDHHKFLPFICEIFDENILTPFRLRLLSWEQLVAQKNAELVLSEASFWLLEIVL